MQNGLYAAEFKTPLGEGAGVVTLLNGTITGGDSAMFYYGTYKVDGPKFTAEVRTGRHHNALQSVFGKDAVTIKLAGTHQNDRLTSTGSAAEAPGVAFNVNLKLIAVGGPVPTAGTAPSFIS